MKRIIIFLLVAVVVGACREEEAPFYPVQLTAPETASAHQSPEVVLAWEDRNSEQGRPKDVSYHIEKRRGL